MSDYTVLFVDDEVNILNSLKRLLRKESFKLLTASSGQEGLEIIEKEAVQVVVSDYRMPEMSGTEFLQVVKSKCPDTIRIVLSGYAEVHAIMDAINKGEIYRFICKPWNDDELLLTIRQCLNQYKLKKENDQLLKKINQSNPDIGGITKDLFQHSIMSLPLAILGIDTDGNIFLKNHQAESFAPFSEIKTGTPFDSALPQKWTEEIKNILSNKKCPPNCLLPNDEAIAYAATLSPIMQEQDFLGCTITVNNTENT